MSLKVKSAFFFQFLGKMHPTKSISNFALSGSNAILNLLRCDLNTLKFYIWSTTFLWDKTPCLNFSTLQMGITSDII